jgi:hypothetical protein
MQSLDILLDRVNELGLVLLDGTPDLMYGYCKNSSSIYRERRQVRTFGLTNSALNFENTRNISLALRAVPRRSRSREMIWFSTRDTRSLYAFSAATQISVPSNHRHELHIAWRRSN